MKNISMKLLITKGVKERENERRNIHRRRYLIIKNGKNEKTCLAFEFSVYPAC
jgi:hypothetical protein